MSGGYWDYNQWKIEDMANSLETYIYGEPLEEDEVEEYIEDHFLDENEVKYIREHCHTIPNAYSFNENTIKEFKKGLEILRKAYIYTQRIDWLLSGDDGEESFHKRLKEDLEKLKLKK